MKFIYKTQKTCFQSKLGFYDVIHINFTNFFLAEILFLENINRQIIAKHKTRSF